MSSDTLFVRRRAKVPDFPSDDEDSDFSSSSDDSPVAKKLKADSDDYLSSEDEEMEMKPQPVVVLDISDDDDDDEFEDPKLNEEIQRKIASNPLLRESKEYVNRVSEALIKASRREKEVDEPPPQPELVVKLVPVPKVEQDFVSQMEESIAREIAEQVVQIKTEVGDTEAGNRVSIVFRIKPGEEIVRNVGWDETFKETFVKVCKHIAKPRSQISFIFDGNVVSDINTPNKMEMEDEDIVDVKIKK